MKKVFCVIVVAAVLMLAACGKKKEEDKRPEGSYGFTKYRYFANAEDNKIVVEEYENLITESFHQVCDNDGKMSSAVRAYYDDTGEHLLKTVEWGATSPAIAKEYDEKGRLLSEKTMFVDETGRTIISNGFQCPNAYIQYSMKPLFGMYLHLQYFSPWQLMNTIPSASIVTTYTYKEDSYAYASICSATEEGKVIASLELGEGEIVLSEKLDGDRMQYEETYNEAERTARFEGTIGELKFVGGKRYDAEDRCTLLALDYLNDGIHYEIQFEYEDDGYWENTLFRNFTVTFDNEEAARQAGLMFGDNESPDDEKMHLLYRKKYDSQGFEIISEEYTTRASDGEDTLSFRSTTEHSQDGNRVVSKSRYYWNPEISNEYLDTDVIVEYSGNERITTFLSNGEVSSIERVIEEEIPGIVGNVRHTTEESDGFVRETYELSLSDYFNPTRVNLVTYSSFFSEGDVKVKTVSGKFDEEGHLSEVERHSEEDNDTVTYEEYDAKGRLCKTREVWKSIDSEIITEWEYWDN